jgi:hypothetical protein
MRIYFVLSIALILAVTSEAIKSKKLKKVISGHHKTTKGMYVTKLTAIIAKVCSSFEQALSMLMYSLHGGGSQQRD